MNMSDHSSDKQMSNSMETNSSDVPITNKESIDGKWFGFSAMQGYRPHMEDCHQQFKHLDDHPLWKKYSYFAIFDGHSGIGTARNASDYLHIHLLHEFNRITKKSSGDNEQPRKIHPKEFRRAIKKAFMKLDKNLRTMDSDSSGSVCVASLIGPKNIYLINVGDARAIIISSDGRVLSSTHDHTPEDPAEQERVYEAGGEITRKSPGAILRVEHRLAMTRVLGDFKLDKNIVPPIPDIKSYSRKSDAAFLILASDGIWSVMSNKDVGRFVTERISETTKLDEIAAQLLDYCLANKGRDNMSVYIVKLQ